LAGCQGYDESYGANPSEEHDEGDEELAEGAQVGGLVEGEAYGAEGGGYFEEGWQELESVRDHEGEGAREDEEGGECENGEGSCDQGVWQGAPEEGDPVLSPDLGDDEEDD
jgi:hypothetical protein